MISAKYRSCMVLIEREGVVSSDPQWGDKKGWIEFRKAWVSIQPNRGREVFRDDEKESVITHTIRGDFLDLDGVLETDRIVYNDTHEYSAHGIPADSRVFDILAVMPNFDGRDDIMIRANEEGRRYGDLQEA